MTELFYPVKVVGDVRTITITKEMLYWYPWIDSIRHKNVYLALSLKWKADGSYPDDPPPGYEYYITSGDSLMFGWPEHLIDKIDGQIIHLSGAIMPDSFDTDRIQYVPYNTAHQTIQRLSGPQIDKKIQYKASALTNRISQSKAIIFAALMHILDEKDRTVSLNANIVNYNVHGWQLSGHAVCDRYTSMFKQHWLDKKISLPGDNGMYISYNNPAYKNTALNFTQESYSHSFMINGTRSYIEPGPFVTEKTFKCLLSKTAFVPVGQAYTYQWLEQLGCRFDYGALNLEFDQDPGNLTRLEKIISLIESLQQWSAQDLYEMTLDSTQHNYELVTSSRFWDTCEQSNAETYKILTNI
jgi:hypothetical protein